MNDTLTAPASEQNDAIFICASEALQDGGKGVRFPVLAGGDAGTGFVVRYDGKAHGYLNRCAHVPIELDWEHGTFFESSGLYIMCSTHGAIYLPDSGYCTGGPCKGGRLRQIAVVEHESKIFWKANDYVKPPVAASANEATAPIST